MKNHYSFKLGHPWSHVRGKLTIRCPKACIIQQEIDIEYRQADCLRAYIANYEETYHDKDDLFAIEDAEEREMEFYVGHANGPVDTKICFDKETVKIIIGVGKVLLSYIDLDEIIEKISEEFPQIETKK